VQQIGPYEVVGELGRGAAGVVYRVRDPRVAGRELAIKVITVPGDRDSSLLERFLREAEVLARVHHEGVVRVHGFERHPQGAYLIQEIVEGVLLEDRIREGPLPPEEAAQLARGLADALTAVHRQGILHRDLKPGNVILRDGKPVLLDFGVARDADAETLTQAGAMLGTPAYMPPEQAAGEPVGPTADVYSVGAVLYELLTGVRPFRGSLLAVIKQVLDDTPTWPRALGADVPAELEAVLRTAMAKAPEDRYPSAEALREDLDRYLTGRPTQAGARPTPSSRGAGLVIAAGLLLLGALGAAALTVRPWEQEPVAAPALPEVASPEPATPAAGPLLWQLERGDRFQAQLTFDERATGQLRMDATLEVVVDRIEADTAYLVLSVPRIAAQLRVVMGNLDAPARVDAPLSQALQNAMAEWYCTLDLRTGAVSMSGLEEIQGRIRRDEETIGKVAGVLTLGDERGSVDLPGLLCRVFSSTFLEASMGSLTHVVDTAWRGDPISGRYAVDVEEDTFRLPVLQQRLPKQPVRVEGTATYVGGRLESAELQQSLVGRPGCSTRWSWTLLE